MLECRKRSESGMRKALTKSRVLLLSLSVCWLGACRGNVEHPDPGETSSVKYCADRKPEENNCMACSSRPGCGWCSAPQEGWSQCQPGAAHETPESCEGGWALSTEECEAPPPPPPPPPSIEANEPLPGGESVEGEEPSSTEEEAAP